MGLAIAFWVFAVVAVLGALGVVVLRNVFRAALSLVLCLLAVAGLYVTLSADFLAAAQILIYVGAISVLIILAIMMTRDVQQGSPSNRLQVPAFLVVVMFLAIVVFAVTNTPGVSPPRRPPSPPPQRWPLSSSASRASYCRWRLPRWCCWRRSSALCPGEGEMIRLEYYLVLSALLFSIGLYGAFTKRNAVVILMCIELMLNAVNVTLVAFSSYVTPTLLYGQVFAIFIMVVAAAEVAVGLAVILAIYRAIQGVDSTNINLMKW